MLVPANVTNDELIKCDCGCGDNAHVFCDDAAYCDDCFSEEISKHIAEFTGWRPCGRLLYHTGNRAHLPPSICMERHGIDHDHG